MGAAWDPAPEPWSRGHAARMGERCCVSGPSQRGGVRAGVGVCDGTRRRRRKQRIQMRLDWLGGRGDPWGPAGCGLAGSISPQARQSHSLPWTTVLVLTCRDLDTGGCLAGGQREHRSNEPTPKHLVQPCVRPERVPAEQLVVASSVSFYKGRPPAA